MHTWLPAGPCRPLNTRPSTHTRTPVHRHARMHARTHLCMRTPCPCKCVHSIQLALAWRMSTHTCLCTQQALADPAGLCHMSVHIFTHIVAHMSTNMSVHTVGLCRSRCWSSTRTAICASPKCQHRPRKTCKEDKVQRHARTHAARP